MMLAFRRDVPPVVPPTGSTRVLDRYRAGITAVDLTGVRTDTQFMGIAVLGPLRADGDGQGLARRDRVVLAALIVQRGNVLSAESLAGALWADSPPPSWHKVVQGCVMRLRKVLGPNSIETVAQGYRLNVGVDQVDAHLFERLLGRARELLTLGEPERAGYLLGEALGLWSGGALQDLGEWEAGRIEASRLEQLRLDAEELEIEAALSAGDYRSVLGLAESRVTAEPLRERRWALLATAQYQAGRQAEALRTLRRVRTVLTAELGLDPGPDLVALEQAILRQDPSLLAADALPAPSGTCPYRGLLAYGVGDADVFFGREQDLASCLRRLTSSGVLAVVGPSGCGKSSLVRAGVAAALERDGRRTVVITPGVHPTEALTALATSGATPLLIVDQCEEVFGLVDDASERARFFDALVEHAADAEIVIALRADRLGELSAHPRFARLVEKGLYLLGAMDEEGLREAIEGPARQAALRLEPGLVDLLVREVEGEPGALPLLSHALREAWHFREGRALTVAGYQRTGGIRGAVARSAEEVYEQVAAHQRPMLRDLLLRLVSPAADGEAVRSRVPRRLLAMDPEHEQIVEMLVRSRLVTSDAGVLELAHEALTRAWPRLQAWLDDDSEGQRILRHVSGSADAWDAMGRPPSELYRGTRLAQTLEWRERADPDLTPTEEAFIDAGRTLAEHERRSAEQQVRRQRRANRRLRGLLAGLAVLLIASTVAGLAAVRSADRADRATAASEARRVGAQALLDDDIDQSLLLAAAAAQLHDSPDTRANLLAALSRKPQLIGATRGRGSSFYRMDVSPDGRSLAVYDDSNRLWFYDTATRHLEAMFNANRPGHDEITFYPTSAVDYSPDGRRIAVGLHTLAPRPVQLLDTTTHEPSTTQLGGLPHLPSLPIDLSYSADGKYLAVTFDEYRDENASADLSAAYVWRTADLSAPVSRIRLPASFPSLALSPHGDVLYLSAADAEGTPTLTAYDVASRSVVRRFRTTGYPVEISPDGTLLAIADGSTPVILDARTGRLVTRLRGHRAAAVNVRFSDDGRLLASTSDDRTAIVWDIEFGDALETLDLGAPNTWGVGFAPDGSSLYTAESDRGLLTWDLRGDRRFMPRRAHAAVNTDMVGYAEPSPDGTMVAYLETDDSHAYLRVFDVATGKLGRRVDTHHAAYGAMAWRADSRRLATTGSDGFVRVWEPRREALLEQRRVAAGHVAGLDYTSDGSDLVVVERAGGISLVDSSSLKPVGKPVRLDARLTSGFAGPDNHTAIALGGVRDDSLVSYSPSRRWTLVDLDAGRVTRTGRMKIEDAMSADFSPDGERVAISGNSGELLLLDTGTGRAVREPVARSEDQDLGNAEYSADGSLVLTTGAQGAVNLWDGHSADLLGTVHPAEADANVATARFLPGGRSAVVASFDGDVFTWDLTADHWTEFACDVAGRDLTMAEWKDAFGEDRPYRATCSGT